MANEPEPLKVWTPGRPEKKPESDYPSRQINTRVNIPFSNEVAAALRDWSYRTKRHQRELVDRLVGEFLGVYEKELDAQAPSVVHVENSQPSQLHELPNGTSVARFKDDLIDHDLNDSDEKVNKEPWEILSSKSSTGRPGVQAPSTYRGYAVIESDELKQLPWLEREVLEFYSTYARQPVRQRDRVAFAVVADQPLHIIKVGILTSILRFQSKWLGKRQIKTLRYCIGAIEEMSEDKPTTDYLDYLLDHWRRHWQHYCGAQPNLPTMGGEVKDFARDDS